ncbi:MAG: cupin domain-containing protein [Piscirickettsiaceae bacterium]|nr:cupin domain-containing protein [Piscirickettsiaceae bacterium]
MPEIIIEKNVSEEKLKELGVSSWNIWDCPVSEFRLDFDGKSERSFILEGEIVVTPDGGKPVTIVPGDYVIFPDGLKSVWEVTKTLKKHYLHF